MAAKSKARVIIARLMSTAGTGYFYTTTRLRTADRIVMRKYDPKGESGAAVCWVGSERQGSLSRELLRSEQQQAMPAVHPCEPSLHRCVHRSLASGRLDDGHKLNLRCTQSSNTCFSGKQRNERPPARIARFAMHRAELPADMVPALRWKGRQNATRVTAPK